MSRCEACLKVTSWPPSRIRPEVGSSSPAIIRNGVVFPHPDGPSRQKKSPSGTVKVEPRTATKSVKALCRFSTRISAIALLRKLGDDREQGSSHQGGQERVGVERHGEGLQEHEDARRDDGGGGALHESSPQPGRPPPIPLERGRGHLRTAP